MLLVDTNVLIDIFEDDPAWANWSINQLRIQSQIHRLAINPIIYSELSVAFSTIEALDQCIGDLDLAMVEIPRQPCFWLARRLSATVGREARRAMFLLIFSLVRMRRYPITLC